MITHTSSANHPPSDTPPENSPAHETDPYSATAQQLADILKTGPQWLPDSARQDTDDHSIYTANATAADGTIFTVESDTQHTDAASAPAGTTRSCMRICASPGGLPYAVDVSLDNTTGPLTWIIEPSEIAPGGPTQNPLASNNPDVLAETPLRLPDQDVATAFATAQRLLAQAPASVQ